MDIEPNSWPQKAQKAHNPEVLFCAFCASCGHPATPHPPIVNPCHQWLKNQAEPR